MPTDPNLPETSTFEIKHRWSGKVLFTATLDVADSVSLSERLGLAAKAAHSAGADLRGADLSGADLRDAYLRDADLRGAYLRGAYLRGANLRDAYLRDAYLRGADLSGADLSGADLRDAYLRDADLRGADLSGADLRDANLRDADLRGAYLRGAPVVPDIHKAVYAAASQLGALDMGSWHTCATTHCRAGWVVTLAGEDGAELEAKIGAPAAAAAIYLASDPERFKVERLPNFYASNKDALADMKRMAEVE